MRDVRKETQETISLTDFQNPELVAIRIIHCARLTMLVNREHLNTKISSRGGASEDKPSVETTFLDAKKNNSVEMRIQVINCNIKEGRVNSCILIEVEEDVETSTTVNNASTSITKCITESALNNGEDPPVTYPYSSDNCTYWFGSRLPSRSG